MQKSRNNYTLPYFLNTCLISVHGGRPYFARTLLAITETILGLAALMPGLASIATYFILEGAPSPDASTLPPATTGFFSLYGEPLVILGIFAGITALLARIIRK